MPLDILKCSKATNAILAWSESANNFDRPSVP